MNRTLYKYCGLKDPKSLARIRDLLQGKIYLSSPLNFNDPFELSAKVDISKSPLLKNHSRRETEEIHRIFRLASPEAVSDEWKKKIGILCLSENPLHILMWSHYASDHGGICIGFDSTQAPFRDAIKVTYGSDRPRIGINSNPETLIRNVFLKKSKHWNYEDEWRIIRRTVENDERDFYYDQFTSNNACIDEISEVIANNAGPGLYDFEPDAIRSVFLGARITEEHKNKIIDFVKSANPKIKIFSVTLDNQYFCLNKQRIKYT